MRREGRKRERKREREREREREEKESHVLSQREKLSFGLKNTPAFLSIFISVCLFTKERIRQDFL